MPRRLEKITAMTSTPSMAPPKRMVMPLPTPEIRPPKTAHSSRSSPAKGEAPEVGKNVLMAKEARA